MCKQKLHSENIEEYINYQSGEKLDLERVFQLKDNTMLKVKPDLWMEWDFQKNEELGFDAWKMTKGSDKIAWWQCDICGSDFNLSIKHRANGRNCPYCAGKRVNQTNSLASLNPELASQWHTTKNTKTPHEVSINSKQKVWWECENNHEWEAVIGNRSKPKGTGCPYCSGQKAWKGFNDMWTTNPKLASMLANPEDGYKYTQFSNEHVDWKCPTCGEAIKNKNICNIARTTLFCRYCSDGVSYPEKIILNLLRELNVEFIKELTIKHFTWVENKRYDFYIPSLNLIIETHGKQHYEQTGRKGARTLEEEQENDKHKYELAMKNGIKPDDYIVIDCRYSELEWIKINVLNSMLNKIFDLSSIDWENIGYISSKSISINTCSLWDKGYSTYEISEILHINRNTVTRYLKNMDTLGKINYNTAKESKINLKRMADANKKKVVGISESTIYHFNSIVEASLYLNVNQSAISGVCKGKKKTSGGFKWMYREDYDKHIEEQNQNKLA